MSKNVFGKGKRRRKVRDRRLNKAELFAYEELKAINWLTNRLRVYQNRF